MLQINTFRYTINSHPTVDNTFGSEWELLGYFDDLIDDRIGTENDVYQFGDTCTASTRFIVLSFNCTTGLEIAEINTALERFDYHFIYHKVSDSVMKVFRVKVIFPLSEAITYQDYIRNNVASRLAVKMGIIGITGQANDPLKKHHLPFYSTDSMTVGSYVSRGQACLSINELFPRVPSVRPRYELPPCRIIFPPLLPSVMCIFNGVDERNQCCSIMGYEKLAEAKRPSAVVI